MILPENMQGVIEPPSDSDASSGRRQGRATGKKLKIGCIKSNGIIVAYDSLSLKAKDIRQIKREKDRDGRWRMCPEWQTGHCAHRDSARQDSGWLGRAQKYFLV